MSLNKHQLDTCRELHAEFKRLLREGDRSDPATMIAIIEVSGFLSESVPHLLAEIDRLKQRKPAEPPRVLKLDARGGVA